MTASWRGLRRIDNLELSTTLKACMPTWPLCQTYLATYGLCHPHQHSCEARTANKQAPEKMARHVTQGILHNWIIYSTPPRSVRWWS